MLFRLVVSLLLLLCTSWQPAFGKVHGVQGIHVSYYDAAEASKHFQCFDGSKIIPFAAVNDDVCDCLDGSDEPGTPACATMRNGVVTLLPEQWMFQCTNKGFFDQQIPHSQVNDGICDCCDGSDELASGVSCPNRCVEVESELAHRMKEEEKRMKAAAANKAFMVNEMVRHREILAKALPGQEAERENILAELPALEEKHNALQKVLESMREELQLKREKREAEREEKEAAVARGFCIKWRQTGRCKPDGPRESAQDKDCEALISSRASGFCECGREDDDESVADEDDSCSADREEDNVKYEFSCGHPELTCSHVCGHDGEAAVGATYDDSEDLEEHPSPEATAAEELLRSRRNRLAELEKSIEETTRMLSVAPNSTEELLRTLKGKTFTMDFQDYTYAVTMFEEVRQRVKGAGDRGPLLGTWKTFAENTYAMWAKDAFDLTQMLYDNGARCWNGVYRKTDIQLVCGPENKLSHIEEPAMCVYSMVFETPALCDD